MKWFVRAALLAALLAVSGCIPQLINQQQSEKPIAYGPATEKQIESALQRYSRLVSAMDASAVADMYAPDGVWERQSGPLQGRSAIRAALEANGGVRVVSNDMTTAFISYNGPAIVQTGDFRQSVRLPDGKIVNAAGKFEATWVKGENGDWWIRRMIFRPGK